MWTHSAGLDEGATGGPFGTDARTYEAGRITGFSFASEVHYEKVPWHGRLRLHKALLCFFAALFVAGAAGGGAALWQAQELRPALWAATLNGLLSVLTLAYIFVLMRLDAERQRTM